MDQHDETTDFEHLPSKPQQTLENTVRLVLGGETPCPYLPNKSAQYAVLTQHDKSRVPYTILVENGFRRDGHFIFRPMCEDCNACQSLKVSSHDFRPKRRHKRNLKKNQDITLSRHSLKHLSQYFDLFLRYQQWRHPEQSHHLSENSLTHFHDPEIASFALVASLGDKTVAVTIVDQLRSGFSAVYTFYDPDQQHRGLGTFMIVKLLEQAKHEKLTWVYLGYYVEDCAKLAYKSEFEPAYVYANKPIAASSEAWIPIGQTGLPSTNRVQD